MYFFVNKTFEVGGLKTLALTEALGLSRKQKKACLVCNYLDKETETICCNNEIVIIRIKKWSAKCINKSILQFENEIDFVQFFGFSEFIAFYIENNNRYKAQYYCVNPVGMNLFQKTKFLKRVFHKDIKKMIQACVESQNIFFMDETMIRKNLSYYNLSNNTEYCKIINLPFKISNYSPRRECNTVKNVLAIARAAFPFKGYLIGLIDKIDIHYKDLPPFRLTVISTGDDINILKQKIECVNSDLKKSIILIEGVLSQKLNEYYENADLYVGMGQTVLEAANYGVPSIVVEYDTFEFISQGFFSNNPNNLGSVYLSGCDGIKDLKYALSLSDDEYYKLKIQTKNALKIYDEEKIIDSIVCLKCDSSFKFSKKTKFLFRIYFIFKQLYFGCI